jgi:hypothetical protein
MTACPKILQWRMVFKVTSPVTQIEVVAVKAASITGVGCRSAEEIGSTKRKVPIRIPAKNPNAIICVVVRPVLIFLAIFLPPAYFPFVSF